MANKEADTQTIPVTEDVLVVGRRAVEVGTVSVEKTTETRQAIVDEPVISEEVRIERRRIDRSVSAADPPVVRTEGDTTIIPVLEEVVVVEKRLMLREEIHLTRVRHARSRPREVTLRREQVHVDRIAAPVEIEGRQKEAATPAPRSSSDESDPQE